MKNQNVTRTVMLIVLATFTQVSQAATVDAELCLTATIVDQTPYEVIFGSGGPVCASISGSAVATIPGDTVIFNDTDDLYGPIAGGTNTTGSTVYYTIQFDWTYFISTSINGSNEIADAMVRSDFLGIEYTSGSGSGSVSITTSIENNVSDDWFADLFVSGSATSIAPVPLPPSLLLFMSGLGLLGLNRRRVH